MKVFLKIFLYYALIPFIASIPGLFVASGDIIVVPLAAALIYLILSEKHDLTFAFKVNEITAVTLFICFMVMMLISSGNVDGDLMDFFCKLIFPFEPIILNHAIMGDNIFLFLAALLTYTVAFMVTAYFSKIKLRKVIAPTVIAIVCLITSLIMYSNRPAVRYKGHGFDYMHGYSSTDFTNYTVYAPNSKLAALDHEPTLVIENEEDMPVLDGAEACYPLYAAFAKAVYKDIDIIEQSEAGKDKQYYNGRIVTFTNTINGFNRLIEGENHSEENNTGVDMLFGANPSSDQMESANKAGVELEITPIGREAFVFFVEDDNPVSDLTEDQLREIYHGDISNWCELGGKNQKIVAFQRPKNSGSQTMMEYFMADIPLKEPLTYEVVEPMRGVIKNVAQYANEKGAIGYSFRYFLEELTQEKGVKMLSVDGVYPSLDNIENGSYPLVTNVCLITRKNESNPYVQKMIDFILSDDGQKIVRETGYAGISTEVWGDVERETEPLQDIGENYYKETTSSEVVKDPDSGISYVENQLLISCDLGTDKELVENICEKFDAEIVGYTEITGDFQIEFKEYKTYDDLMKIADEIETGYDFVSMVYPNTVTETTYDDAVVNGE